MTLAQNLSFILLGEDRSASKAMEAAESTAQRVTGKIGAGFSKLGGIIGGEFGEILNRTGDGVEEFGKHGANLAKSMIVAGGVITGAGLALLTFGSGEKQATDQLDAAIKASGGVVSDYREEIEKAVQAGQSFDHESEDTKKALTILTEATGSTEDALKRMNVVTDLAAAKHISLEDAAGMVAKILGGGGGKVLKAYGVQMETNADGTKNVEKALSELAGKLDGQAKASVNNFGSQVDIVKTKIVDWAKEVAGPLGTALTAVGPFLSIAGVAMDIYKGKQVATTVATLAQTTAATAATVATEAETVAQVGLNVAMDANPVGLVALALGGLAAIVGGTMLLQGTQDNTAAIRDFTAALEADTGAIGDNTRATAAKMLLDSGALQAANDLGISKQDLISATIGEADAQARVTQAITDHNAALEAMRPAVADNVSEVEAYNEKLDANDAKVKALTDSMGLTSSALTDAKNNDALLRSSLDNTAASLDVAERRAAAYRDTLGTIPSEVNTSFGQSGSFGGTPYAARAAGGIVTRPQINLVGESGPEAIIPLNAGLIGMGSSAPSQSIEIHFNGPVMDKQGAAKWITDVLTQSWNGGLSTVPIKTALGI